MKDAGTRMMNTNSGLMTSLKMSALNGNGQEQRQPPELGDFRLQKTSDGWELYIGERRVLSALTFAQALQLIRGEFSSDALRRGKLEKIE